MKHWRKLLLVAGLGAALVWGAPRVASFYQQAQDLEPPFRTVYLLALWTGLGLLGLAAAWVVWSVFAATYRKRAARQRRARNPSQLTAAEKEREFRDNLSASGELATAELLSEAVRREIRGQVESLTAKRQSEQLEIVAFGTISSGKSALLNALAGRDLFCTDPRGGTTLQRTDVPWPGRDRVILTDTPGIAEVQGEQRAADAAAAAQEADLILFVVDGPLKAYEMELLRQLGDMQKRVLLCLNKGDWFTADEQQTLMDQLGRQVDEWIHPRDIVAVSARPGPRQRVRVLPDGSQARESVGGEPWIVPLADRLMQVLARDGRELLLANLLLQSRGMVERSKLRAREALDRQAEGLIQKSMWAAGGIAAVNPLPLLDLAGGAAVAVKLVLDLARVYRQEMDTDAALELLSRLSRQLISILGVTAATPAVVALVGSVLKTVPGAGTVAGGLLQGLVQSLVIRWMGRVFMQYFQAEMQLDDRGLVELAQQEWEQLTQPRALLKLIQTGRRELSVPAPADLAAAPKQGQ